MVRPRFETSRDLANEESLMEKILNSSYENHDAKKLPPQYYIDYMVMNSYGRPTRLIELKQRNNNHNDFGTYIISLKKIINGQRLADSIGIPFELAVRFNDGDYMVELGNSQSWKVKWFERNSNRDGWDGEPVVHIPMSEFMRI